jgi:hypothetical protein
MAKEKKTVSVDWLRKRANEILAGGCSQEGKAAISVFIEEILMEAGQYKGFNYTYWMNQGCQEWNDAGRPEDKTQYLGLEYNRQYF